MSNDRKSKTLQADVRRFPAEISTALSKMWTGLKMRLFSCKLAATNFGIILSPHSEREMKYSICQSWSGYIRKKTSPNLLLLVVEDWALVSRVLLQQRVTELPFHPNSSVSTTCPGDQQETLKSSSVLVEKIERLVKHSASKKR